MDSGNSKLMIFLIASLMLTSALTSYFVMAKTGYSITQFNTPIMGLDSYTLTHDFISNCTLSDYVTTGIWSCSAQGMSLTGGGELKQLMTDKERERGIYKNTYHLYPQGGDYYILIWENWIYSKVKLEVRNDGFHVKYSTLLNWFNPDAVFIPYAGATSINDIIITTTTDTITPSISINIAGKDYSVNMDRIITFTNSDLKYPIGVGADNNIIVASITKSFIADTTQTASALDSLNMILGFVGNMLTILVWNLDPSIFPWELNLILIKPQALGIFICLITLVRS